MLINLTNHPLSQWSEKQLKEAKKLYGKIVDLPFPQIPANWDSSEVDKLSEDYLNTILSNCQQGIYDKNNLSVHIMGEMTFCFSLIKKLQSHNIKCIASTTERNVVEDGNTKKVIFEFCKFRNY